MKQRAIYLLALPALLACCTQDEPGNGAPGAGENLQVSSTVLGAGSHTETGPVTRPAGGEAPVSVTQGSLGIFRSQGTGYTGALDNKKYTYAAGGWQPATQGDAVALNGSPAEVCAYYPYNGDGGYSDKTALPLASGKYTGTAGTHDAGDLCYDTDREVSATKSTTSFIMKHALAMMELKLSTEPGYTGECRLTGISLVNPELITSSAVNITNGTYSSAPLKGPVSYGVGTDAAGIPVGNAAVSTAALLVPFTPAAPGLRVALTVNETPVEAVIPVAKMNSVQAGRRYTVKITLKNSLLQVTGVDMMPWTDTAVGGDGTVWYPEPPKYGINVPEKDINLGGEACKLADIQRLAKLTWATGNLRQQNDNGSGPTIMAGPTDRGHYYTFMSEYTGTTASNGKDPCKSLDAATYGTGWRTPSKEEMDALTRCTDKTLTNGGMWFMNSTKGLFLPLAGSRNNAVGSGTTPTFNPGTVGIYWSSGASGNSSDGYGLGFSSDRAGINYYYGTDGCSVRCVKGL